MIKFFSLLSMMGIFGGASVSLAQAETLIVSSTAIVSHLEKACPSKSEDTNKLIAAAEKSLPEIQGAIAQDTQANTRKIGEHYDLCASRVPTGQTYHDCGIGNNNCYSDNDTYTGGTNSACNSCEVRDVLRCVGDNV